MARVFITGSADGLGQLSAEWLIGEGHMVVLHARDEKRGVDAIKKNPKAEAVLTGDLSSTGETRNLADRVNQLGLFDAVIHNAGVYQASSKEIFSVNVLAPYILTCMIKKPKRLIYLSSGMHLHGSAKLDRFNLNQVTYSDSKLYVLMLCMAVTRKWKDIYANAANPGWVPTKMGGRGAPDDLTKGFATQVWLAASNDEKAKVNGRYFFHQKQSGYNSKADDIDSQEKLLSLCKELTGISFH